MWNSATDGAGLANLFGGISIANSSFTNNQATHQGGGYFQYTVEATSPDASADVSNTYFEGNSDSAGGADIFIYDDVGNRAKFCDIMLDEIYAGPSATVEWC